MPYLPSLLVVSLVIPLGLACTSSNEKDPPDDGNENPIAGACEFDDSVDYNILGETLQLQGDDSCLIIHRINECGGDEICKAAPFKWTSLAILVDGQEEIIEDSTKLAWTPSHHNWEDVGVATGATRKYVLESDYPDNFEFEYSLNVYEASSDALILGPIKMVPYAP